MPALPKARKSKLVALENALDRAIEGLSPNDPPQAGTLALLRKHRKELREHLRVERSH